ncbi:CoA pyrophosphatase [Viridibacterium curvum]|uniref:Nudix hydrolase domain-containing protein n=1 Tax=Viridibacterium curvum TaxID=1101404 RepID=A0ABP9QWT1_9RHOO
MPDTELLVRLRALLPGAQDFAWSSERQSGEPGRAAAVLMPIQQQADGLHLLLTRRTDHLHHHPGQISLPGGRIDAGDADARSAALRECEEEIGLRAAQVELLGQLPDYGTWSGFHVTPFVGLVSADYVPKLDSFEVAELFSVPLAFLLDQGNYQHHRVERDNARRHFFAVPWQGRFIWGVTAGMLAMLSAFVARNGR